MCERVEQNTRNGDRHIEDDIAFHTCIAESSKNLVVGQMVAITLLESHSAFDSGWSAMLYNATKDEYCFSKKYDLHIIDRVSGGDSGRIQR